MSKKMNFVVLDLLLVAYVVWALTVVVLMAKVSVACAALWGFLLPLYRLIRKREKICEEITEREHARREMEEL